MSHLDEVFDYPLTGKQKRELRKKARRRNGNQTERQQPRNGGLNLASIYPKTAAQELVFQQFEDEYNILAHGYPGTGKTFLFTYLCLNEIINNPNSQFKKLIIVRSTQATRDQGFLPGDEKQKAAVYEAPYVDIFAKLFGRGDAYEIAKKMGLVEFRTTNYVRGITLDNCLVIVDETQNLSFHENASIITRLGDTTRVYFAGDFRQSDLKWKDEKDGVVTFLNVIKCMKSFAHVEMGVDDIVRGRIVKEFIVEAVKQGLM